MSANIAPNMVEGPNKNNILIMVGTKKGTFLFWSDDTRKTWRRSDHHLGWSTYTLSYDARHNTIYAATVSEVFGSLVQRSNDLGQSWDHVNSGLDFDATNPITAQERVREIWQVTPGHAARPNELWAGTGRAGLFRSADRGTTWSPIDSLNLRRKEDKWDEGAGGMILHTIVPDPVDENRIYVAISTGGAYRSDDRGASWTPINRNVLCDFLPEPYPETGQCVHKMALHPARPNVLFQQNHCGVYRSENRGDTWADISDGLPSRFGFPIVIHPHDPSTIYVVPMAGPEERFAPNGEMAVYRSRDDGNTWQKLDNGLPKGAYLVTLRDSMAADPCDTVGIYVGTSTGQLFFSHDAGDSWELMANFLPPIYSVSAARVVG